MFAEDLERVKDHHHGSWYRLCQTIPVIHEDSSMMLVWDIVLVFGLFWVMWAVPFEIGFAESLVPGQRLRKGYEWLLTMDLLVDMFFWIDILINFRVTYRERNTHKHILDPYMIAYHYSTTWFVPDLLSVVPFAEIFYVKPGSAVATAAENDGSNSDAAGLVKLTRVLRFLKLTKLIRLLKIAKFIYVLEDRCGVSPLLFSFGYLIAVVFLVIHLLASVFYLCSFTLTDPDQLGKL